MPRLALLATLASASHASVARTVRERVAVSPTAAAAASDDSQLPWAPVGGFTHVASANVSSIRARVKEMPFLAALVDGTLPQDTFAFYLTQDSLYLRQYARVLAALSAKAPTVNITQNMARAADVALVVEGALHEVFLSTISNLSAEERRATPPSPTCQAYTDYLQARLAFSPFEVAYAAAIPCFTIYAEVGRHILSRQVPLEDHPYAQWIQTYGGEAFEQGTARATWALDALAERATPAMREEMLEAFRMSARFEWSFWDSAWRREQWPLPLP